MYFPRLFDRWVQNLRRCAGFKVQYFGAIEPQRRLAPHIHVALRGAIPRATIPYDVTTAAYLQLWWPSFDQVVYADPDRFPVWDEGKAQTYRDTDTGFPLPTWQESLDALDGEQDAGEWVEPAVVMRFGTQVDIQGIIAPSVGRGPGDPVPDEVPRRVGGADVHQRRA